MVRSGQHLAVESTYTSNLLPKIEAAPWPYFPVDLLPCMIALSVRAPGEIQFWNKVYEGGFTWLPELAKFGAHLVVCDPHRVIVFGDRPLRPAVVEAPYIIRAAVALYMVAASIPGRSVVRNAGDHQPRPSAFRGEPPHPRRRAWRDGSRSWIFDLRFPIYDFQSRSPLRVNCLRSMPVITAGPNP